MVCLNCKIEKPETEYAYKNKQTGLRNTWCKKCKNEYTIQHYYQYRAKYILKARNNRKDIRLVVKRIKAETPCSDCTKQYPFYVMDFDHRENKEFNISQMVRNKSLSAIMKEIDKCDVVCSNCHRERTYRRQQDALVV